MSDPNTVIEGILEEHIRVAQRSREQLVDGIGQLARDLIMALSSGGKLLVFGNGGSAADAQHFAAELAGRFKRARRSLAAVALTTDSSTLTAIANDFDFADIFARQVEGLCAEADVVVGLSTSGDTENVVRGLLAGATAGARTWALTGSAGGRVGDAAGGVLSVPSDEVARIQEMHITIIHAVSELVDAHAAEEAGALESRALDRHAAETGNDAGEAGAAEPGHDAGEASDRPPG